MSDKVSIGTMLQVPRSLRAVRDYTSPGRVLNFLVQELVLVRPGDYAQRQRLVVLWAPHLILPIFVEELLPIGQMFS